MANESEQFCDCRHCQHQLCAQRVPIFSALDKDELSKIVALIIRKHYIKGELILLEGSNHESLVIINNGQAKAFRNTLEGKEHILHIFSSGDFFGEKNLLIKHDATYNVEALEETDICIINKNDFQQLLREYPDIGIKIIIELSNRVNKLEDTIESMSTKNVETRVNSVLLEFAGKYGKSHVKGIIIDLPLSREGIANYIGLTRETVSRKMSILQDEGIIEMVGNKKVIILNIKTLEDSVR